MLFRKRSRSGSSGGQGESGEGGSEPEVYRIDYDMMLKGSVVMRRGKPIRQYGVTVDGATKLITSGDMVDRKTFDALVAAGVVKPTHRYEPGERRED